MNISFSSWYMNIYCLLLWDLLMESSKSVSSHIGFTKHWNYVFFLELFFSPSFQMVYFYPSNMILHCLIICIFKNDFGKHSDKTLESPLDCKEIQPVHSEGDQPWDFFGRNDAKAETPVLWPPYGKSWLIGEDSDAGRDWGQEEKGTTEDVMAGWHHGLDGRESGWTPGVGDGQGGLACCDSWGRKELDTTERLNWTDLVYFGSLSLPPSCHNISFTII